MKYLPNFLSASRGIAALLMLLPDLPANALWWFYLFGGVSDLMDGFLARRFGWESAIGEKIDSFSDLLFTVAVLFRLFPQLPLPSWVWWECGLVALLRLWWLCRSLKKNKKLPNAHTLLNRLTGLLLFLLPFTSFLGVFRYVLIPVGLFVLLAAGFDLIFSYKRSTK